MRLCRREMLERLRAVVEEIADLRQRRAACAGSLDFHRQPPVAQCMSDARPLDHLCELAGPQQCDGGYGNAARLPGGEHAGGHHRAVERGNQHTIAGNESHVFGQHVRDAVHLVQQLRVSRAPLRADDRGARSVPHAHPLVEQDARAVDLVRKTELGQVEPELGPQFGRRHVVAGESIAVGGPAHGPRQISLWAAASRSWRAMISFCTSVAPS